MNCKHPGRVRLTVNVQTHGRTRLNSLRSMDAEGYYNYCPRDVLLVRGDHIIETPNVSAAVPESFAIAPC